MLIVLLSSLVSLDIAELRGSDLPAKTLALTFDDGPAERTSELSTYLKNNNIRATFYVNSALMDSPEKLAIVAQLVADGHLVANHTHTHADLLFGGLTPQQVIDEVTQCDTAIAPYVPSGRFLFRAPSASWDSTVYDILAATPMTKYVGPISYDVGGQLDNYPNAAADWACWRGDTITYAPGQAETGLIPIVTYQQCGQAYLNEIQALTTGGIVVMHDAYTESVDMALWLIPQLIADGYTFVRDDEVPSIAAKLGGPPPPAPTGSSGTTGATASTMTPIASTGITGATMNTEDDDDATTDSTKKGCNAATPMWLVLAAILLARKRWALLLLLGACDGALFAPAEVERRELRRVSGSAADQEPEKDENGRYICNDAIHAGLSESRRITRNQYQRIIADVFNGHITASDKFPAHSGQPASGFSTDASINVVGSQGTDNIMYAAEDVAERVVNALPQLLACSSGEPCATQFIDTYVRRAFRHTITDEERATLMSAFNAGENFSEGIAFTVVQALQMPQFVYVVEASGGAGRALSGDELASRLSFMLWDSVPDDALLAKAATLTDRSALSSTAREMLSSPRADTALARFFREWTRTVEQHDTSKVASFNFTEAQAESMLASFDRFVATQAKTGTLTSLLTSNELFVDAELAAMLGVEAPPAGQWQKVALDPARYSGMMTQPAMMATLAHADSSSYVFRGRFVRRYLLCDPLGSPPADAESTFADIALPPNPTGREASDRVRTNAVCSSCHSLMDPAGLAFEHFNAIGGWRDNYESGRSMDTSGTLTNVGGETLSFSSHTDLLQQLAASPRVQACFAKQIFRFTMSRAEVPADGCALQGIGDALTATNGQLGEAMVALVTSDAFNYRMDP